MEEIQVTCPSRDEEDEAPGDDKPLMKQCKSAENLSAAKVEAQSKGLVVERPW